MTTAEDDHLWHNDDCVRTGKGLWQCSPGCPVYDAANPHPGAGFPKGELPPGGLLGSTFEWGRSISSWPGERIG